MASVDSLAPFSLFHTLTIAHRLPPFSPISRQLPSTRCLRRLLDHHQENNIPFLLCVASIPLRLYEVLGIQIGYTFQEIKAAYRRLARVLHPVIATNGPKEETTFEFIKILKAYETLYDPDKRADYDRLLLWRGATRIARSSASRLSRYTRRNWETDQCW